MVIRSVGSSGLGAKPFFISRRSVEARFGAPSWFEIACVWQRFARRQTGLHGKNAETRSGEHAGKAANLMGDSGTALFAGPGAQSSMKYNTFAAGFPVLPLWLRRRPQAHPENVQKMTIMRA